MRTLRIRDLFMDSWLQRHCMEELFRPGPAYTQDVLYLWHLAAMVGEEHMDQKGVWGLLLEEQ